MDVYLESLGRSKGEWFPDQIAGVMRASKTEIMDDIEYIQANLPFNPSLAQVAGGGDDDNEGAEGEEGAEGGLAAAAAASSSAAGRGAPNVAAINGNRNPKRKPTKAERAQQEIDREHAASKRARLQNKIALEKNRLESTKERGYHLRQNLDNLRAETQQYEDAIAQTKREMEMIQRETQILEDRLEQSRSEYHWGLDQAERIRIEEEKIETILREKLSQVNTQVNDVSDRVHQLRQLEEEFKLKDVRIQQLETECSKLETIARASQLAHQSYYGASAIPAMPNGNGLPLASSLPIAMPIPASSPTPPNSNAAVLDPNLTVATDATGASVAAVPAAAPTDASATKTEDAAMQDVGAPSETPAESAAAAAPAGEAKPEPVKTEGAEGEAAAPAPVVDTKPADAEAAPAATASPATGAATAPNFLLPGLATIPVAQPGSTSPTAAAATSPAAASGAPQSAADPQTLAELLHSIHQSTSTIAHLTMTLKLHEEQLESSNRHLIDRDRACKYMQEQIERFSNLNHELNFKLKQSENLTLEERSKLEQSYKQILFAQKQKEQQACMIEGYEEKLKVFEQLLNVADVRASSAEEYVSEMMAELKSSRMSNQILQVSYNKLLREYETAIFDKYKVIEQAHHLQMTLHKGHPHLPIAPPLHLRAESTESMFDRSTPHLKEESPRTPQRSFHTSEDTGFGGINGLASPMAGDHGHHFDHFPAGGVKKPSSLALASPASSSGLASPSATHSSLSHLHSFTLPDGAPLGEGQTAAVAEHYHKFNLLLTQQNKELSMKLNQLTHQNAQLQVALVKLAHRPAKQITTPVPHAAVRVVHTQPLPLSSSNAATSSNSVSTPNVSPPTAATPTAAATDAAAMEVDTSATPAPLTKAISTSASPRLTPRSPLPPFHPNKPAAADEIPDI